jgi:hypothetical protein
MLPHGDILEKKMEGKSWPEIAALARQMQIRLEHEDDEAKKLEAQLRTVKQALIEYLEHPEAMDSRMAEFMSGLSRTIDSMEGQLQKYEMDRHEFVAFLKVLVSKAKKEKSRKSKAEFSRHKK